MVVFYFSLPAVCTPCVLTSPLLARSAAELHEGRPLGVIIALLSCGQGQGQGQGQVSLALNLQSPVWGPQGACGECVPAKPRTRSCPEPLSMCLQCTHPVRPSAPVTCQR